MNDIKLTRRIWLAILIYFIVYNTYFGWNKLPQSEAEINCDYILKVAVYFSIGALLNPLFKRYIFLVKKWDKEY